MSNKLILINACSRCGGELRVIDGYHYCTSCGAKFVSGNSEDEIQKVIDRDNLIKLSGLKTRLYNAVNEKYISSEKILDLCNQILVYNPQDNYARFYEIANSGTDYDIINFLNSRDFDETEAETICDWLIDSLTGKIYDALAVFAATYIKDYEKSTLYLKKINSEYDKLQSGMYSTQIERDVFCAFSGKDIERVEPIVNFIESQGFTCFVSYRNLRHGKGARENYEKALKEAIHNSKCVVFFSSDNSRSLSCDAIDIELPYIKDKEPEMGRIEYILDSYSEKTPFIVKEELKRFFSGLEWCTTRSDLVQRILTYHRTVKKSGLTASEIEDKIRKEYEFKLKKEQEEKDRIQKEYQDSINKTKGGYYNNDYKPVFTTDVHFNPEAHALPKDDPDKPRREGDYVIFGSYIQDNGIPEPIEWRILGKENGEYLLLSEKILDCQIFSDDSNNYEESSLREWLNIDFYNTAFNDRQKQYICKSLVRNDVQSTLEEENESICQDTYDNVFLLSREEANKYLDATIIRQKLGTNYAMENGLWIDKFYNCGQWWLRSPCGEDSWLVYCVGSNGHTDMRDDSAGECNGVVPAIRIKLK